MSFIRTAQSLQDARLNILHRLDVMLVLLGSNKTCLTGYCSLAIALGGYMYIETSFPRRQGDIAVLESPTYSGPPGFTCSVSFFYSMYGATIGNLSVWIKTASSNSLAWSQAGDQGQKWKPANIPIPYGTPSYQVVDSSGTPTNMCTHTHT